MLQSSIKISYLPVACAAVLSPSQVTAFPSPLSLPPFLLLASYQLIRFQLPLWELHALLVIALTLSSLPAHGE